MTWLDTQVDYERHIRLSAVVDTVEAAFAFCLNGIEKEAIELPVIMVEPSMIYEEDATEGRIVFEVAVSGQATSRA